MRTDLPVIYIVDAAVAVTGAFIAARHTARLLQGSAQVVMVLPHGHRIAAENLTDFWRVDTLPIVTISKNLSALLRYIPALISSAWMLKQRMRKDGANRLQLNDFFLLHGVVLRLLGFSGHIISWVRCDPVRFAGPLARPILLLARWGAHQRIAVSQFIVSRLPADYATDVIYDCSMGAALPRIPHSAEKTLVYISNYIRGKGQDMALAAFAIAAAHDPSLRLHFYGGDMGLAKNRAYREELKTAAKRSAYADHIAFHDFVANTAPILQTAYASLNFSTCESFSMTVLEASGAGVPVIATACGGPQEILVDGVTGYLVPVGDAEAAAVRMITLANEPHTAFTMGAAGAAHVAAHFSAAAFTKKLRDVLSLQSV